MLENARLGASHNWLGIWYFYYRSSTSDTGSATELVVADKTTEPADIITDSTNFLVSNNDVKNGLAPRHDEEIPKHTLTMNHDSYTSTMDSNMSLIRDMHPQLHPDTRIDGDGVYP